MLLGYACSCPETGDFFPVITDALQVRGAEQTQFSLAFSGQSWTRIEALVRRGATTGMRLLGQAHGHPFLPGESCSNCGKLAECRSTTAFLSADDRLWNHAVFHGQPLQIGQVFGLDARGQGAEALYTLQDGRLAACAYRIIEDLPEDFPANGAGTGGNR